jgi:hypothetical protein
VRGCRKTILKKVINARVTEVGNFLLVSFSPDDKNLMKTQITASHQNGIRKGKILPQNPLTRTTGIGEELE